MNRVFAALLGFLFALFGSSAFAAIDTTAVSTGISDAQTAVLAVITALLGLSTAIFGLSKVYSFVKRKAGA